MTTRFASLSVDMTLRTSQASTSAVRVAVLAVLISGFVLPMSTYAATPELSPPPQGEEPMMKSGHSKMMSQHDMTQHVEDRIKTLHEKLGITTEQEAKWDEVAQTMRDNETVIAGLIEKRHQNAQSMTALDDLQSYADITQAKLPNITTNTLLNIAMVTVNS